MLFHYSVIIELSRHIALVKSGLINRIMLKQMRHDSKVTTPKNRRAMQHRGCFANLSFALLN